MKLSNLNEEYKSTNNEVDNIYLDQKDDENTSKDQKQEEVPAILQAGSMIMMGVTSLMTGISTLISIMKCSITITDALPSLLTAFGMLLCMLLLPTINKIYMKHKNKDYERKR